MTGRIPGDWLLLGLVVTSLLFLVSALRGVVWGRLVRRPFLSIVILLRNQGDLVEGLLRGLLASHVLGRQPGFDFEIIAVDEGSADDTRQILGRLSLEYPALRAFFYEDVQAGDGLTHGAGVLAAAAALCRSRVMLLLDLRQEACLRDILVVVERVLYGSPRHPAHRYREPEQPARCAIGDRGAGGEAAGGECGR